MSYHNNYLYGGNTARSFPRGQVYEYAQHPHPEVLILNSPLDTMIDPRLGALDTFSPPPQFQSQWQTPHQIQRYLTEPKSSFFNLPPQMPHLQTANLLRQMDGVPPLPPPSHSQGRQGSPASLQPSSSSESDKCDPSTPPDLTMSPYHSHSCYFDQWDGGRAQFCSFTGMGTVQDNTCVMQDINPMVDFEDSPVDLEEPLRTFSYSSTSSLPDYETASNIAPQAEFARQPSPEENGTVTKDEIHVYPSPEQYQEERASEAEIEVKIILDDDDEYKPKRSSRSSGNSGRSVRGRNNKRAADDTASGRGPLKRSRMDSAESGSSIRIDTKGNKVCDSCNSTFKDETSYQKHVKAQHTRPFGCVFGFAGCSSTFASKNEWKRHVITQHLVLHYWVCTRDGCARAPNQTHSSRRGYSASVKSSFPHGTIFNRKDLYTQHVRRMHVPPSVKKAVKNNKLTPEWDNRLKNMQSEAIRERCELPRSMTCPAQNCNTEFKGNNAWDDRMEHVARHLDMAALGKEPAVEFGGELDKSLIEWAASPEVNVIRFSGGKWQLINPLKGTIVVQTRISPNTDTDADADGEVEGT